MKFFPLYIFLLLLLLINNGWRSESTSREGEPVASDIFSTINLSEKGLSREVFNLGIHGLKKLEVESRLKNPGIISIADYSQPSFRKRFYVIDLKQKKLLYNTYVAHGRNTGDVYATSFSNEDGSLKSSLGFYITGQTISASHTGYSLLLNGVEKGFNDHALQRAIIMHGADYVTEEFMKRTGRLGRSYGCPSLPPDISKSVIETIKEGSCLFIYNPDPKYISGSELLH